MWTKHLNAMRAPGAPQVDVNFAVLTFNQISDPTERQRFHVMPTTFHLCRDQADALRAPAGHWLTQAPEFGRLALGSGDLDDHRLRAHLRMAGKSARAGSQWRYEPDMNGTCSGTRLHVSSCLRKEESGDHDPLLVTKSPGFPLSRG